MIFHWVHEAWMWTFSRYCILKMNGKIRLGLIWTNAFIYRQTTLASNCEGLEVEICNTIKNHSRRCDKTFCKFFTTIKIDIESPSARSFLSQMSAIFAFIFQAYNIALDEKSNSISDKFRFTFEMYICAPLLRIRLHYLDFLYFTYANNIHIT